MEKLIVAGVTTVIVLVAGALTFVGKMDGAAVLTTALAGLYGATNPSRTVIVKEDKEDPDDDATK